MNKGSYKNKVKAVILLAPSDSTGYIYKHDKNLTSNLKKAKQYIKKNKKERFLDREAYSYIMPKSAESFINFLDRDSELSKALPFHKKRLELYKKINVPILVVIGDQQEYTVLTVKKALDLLKKENSNTEAHQLQNCNHDFESKEKELTKIVKRFLIKHTKKSMHHRTLKGAV